MPFNPSLHLFESIQLAGNLYIFVTWQCLVFAFFIPGSVTVNISSVNIDNVLVRKYCVRMVKKYVEWRLFSHLHLVLCTRSLKIVPSRTPALTPRKILHIMYMLIFFLFQLYFNFASFHYLMDRLFYFGKMSISRIRRRKIFSSQNCIILNHQIRLMSPIIT